MISLPLFEISVFVAVSAVHGFSSSHFASFCNYVFILDLPGTEWSEGFKGQSGQQCTFELLQSCRKNRPLKSCPSLLATKVRVFLYKGFLSDEECDRLISLAVSSEDKSYGNNGDSGISVSAKLLKSSGTLLNTTNDIVSRIDDRITAWTFLPKDYSMPLQIMQYGGEEVDHKYIFGNKSTLPSNEPLMATVVLYLSDSASGGEMLFPESKIKSKIWSDCTKKSNILRPVKGNAILFFSVHLNASPDKTSSHARCPVLDGELWVATKFFYLRAITGKKEFVESDRDDCTDEDESCPQWAAIGECQRNSVFMIGSPDYYGTCRKSCNAC